jgi:hypothetical protein
VISAATEAVKKQGVMTIQSLSIMRSCHRPA